MEDRIGLEQMWTNNFSVPTCLSALIRDPARLTCPKFDKMGSQYTIQAPLYGAFTVRERITTALNTILVVASLLLAISAGVAISYNAPEFFQNSDKSMTKIVIGTHMFIVINYMAVLTLASCYIFQLASCILEIDVVDFLDNYSQWLGHVLQVFVLNNILFLIAVDIQLFMTFESALSWPIIGYSAVFHIYGSRKFTQAMDLKMGIRGMNTPSKFYRKNLPL